MPRAQGYDAEIPQFRTITWPRLMELDLEMRRAAALIKLLATAHSLPGTEVGQPLIQRFITPEGEEFEGIFLDSINNGTAELKLALALNDQIKGASIRECPPLGVAHPVSSSRDIEVYDLSSLYRLWVTHHVRPSMAFDLTQTLLTRVLSHLVDDGRQVVNDVAKVSHLIHGVDLPRKSWGLAS